MNKKIYFAFGANLNIESMAHRCPNARLIGVAKLEGWKLVFRGVADIVENEQSVVEGALWELTEECELALDYFEGYPNLYGKKNVTATIRGKDVVAMAYVMNSGTISPPSPVYVNTIACGYKALGLDLNCLKQAIRHAEKNYNFVKLTLDLNCNRDTLLST